MYRKFYAIKFRSRRETTLGDYDKLPRISNLALLTSPASAMALVIPEILDHVFSFRQLSEEHTKISLTSFEVAASGGA